jgi:hypothetical protein
VLRKGLGPRDDLVVQRNGNYLGSAPIYRRFNRARYDADQTIAAFAARLKDAVDLDSVRDDLADVVHQALEPAHVSVWISQCH